jgi:type VI secretion system protein ImpH
MYVNFLGLLGPNGPLPLHISEYVHQRQHVDHDPTLARFLDALIHRHIALFYRAWAVNQQTVSFDRADVGDDQDKFAGYIGAMFGVAMESYRQRDAVSDHAKLHYAGHLAGATRNAEAVRSIVSDFFGLITEVVQFVGEWVDLPFDSRCRLGETRQTGLLGSTAILGSRIWQCQYKFRLRLGPMTFVEYERMLPGGKSLARLIGWVKLYVGDELGWDAQLILKKEEVPVCQLGRLGRLGWSTWLKSQPTPRDADDLILNPCYLSGAAGSN